MWSINITTRATPSHPNRLLDTRWSTGRGAGVNGGHQSSGDGAVGLAGHVEDA
jgi:hypothetical protein